MTPLARVLGSCLQTPVTFEQLQTAAAEALEKGEITLLSNGKPSELAKEPQQVTSTLHTSLMDMLHGLYRQGLVTPVEV